MIDAIALGFGFTLGALVCYFVLLGLFAGVTAILDWIARRASEREAKEFMDWQNSPAGKERLKGRASEANSWRL